MTFDVDAWLSSITSPRMALHLWCAAGEIIDRAKAEPDSLMSGLPSVARRWTDDQVWMDRLLDAFRVVRDRLAIGALPIARCTGEEYALHIVIAYAAAAEVQGVAPDPEDYGLQLIPEPDDDDYAAAHDALFEDHDLLLLFDPIFDGIEDPKSEINQRLGIGPYLHPARWYEPFGAYADVDPLAPAPGPELADEDVLGAANDLAMRSGARDFTVSQTGGQWVARARYRTNELEGAGEDPQSAATALVRRILEDGRCTWCGGTITIDPGEGGDGHCHWRREGPRWARGCERTA
jgi:hypothetical protein